MSQTGIGLTLAPHAQSSALRVTAFDPEGPAARGGLIQLGDILYEVDDTSCGSIVGLNGEQVKTLILGAPGSPVTLGLRRQNGRLFYVRIQRAQLKAGPAAQANRQSRPMDMRQQRPPQSQNSYAPAQEQHQYSPPQASRQSNMPAHEPAGKHEVQQHERSNGASPPGPSHQQPIRPSANHLELSMEPSAEGFVSVPPKSEDIVGIGIGLALDNQNNLCISSLLPGSPALRSGLLEEGDILRMVDAKDVRGMTPEAVRPLILGRSGTFVTVSVQRGNTQIVARMARARPAQNASRYIPKAGSSDAPKADKNTYSAVYSQMTAERQETGGIADQQQRREQQQPQPAAPNRKQPPPDGAKAAPADQELCGVGIVLAQNSDGELLVLSMNEGGPAARSNLIKKNDVLYTIDNIDVYKQSIDQVRPLILGIPGSTLVMGFQRPGIRRPINVRLRRGNIKADLKQIPNPSPRPSPSATPGGGATPKQSPSQTPNATRPSSPKPQRPARDNNLVSAPPKSTSAGSEESKYGPDGPVCGLGIVLVPTPFGSLCVASITEGGPAARSGRVLRGDFVETIDGISVQDKSINDVRPLILGRAGTTVTLGLRRESEDSVIYVRVMREPVRLGEVLVPGMRVKDAQELEQQKFEDPPKAPSPPSARARQEPVPVERKQAPPQPGHGNYKPSPTQPRDARPNMAQGYSPGTANKGEAPKMCGVGVVLVQVSGGAVCVKSVNKGGPAYNSGKIQRGDVLFAIDGHKVLGWDVESVKPLIIGPQGSTIVMSFYRVGNQVVGKRSFDVVMTRTPVDPNASLPHRPSFEVATFG